MISSEVQRTLVKSPPELWAEISDPESLARHLGEFGEIRNTRVQPEHEVEWEADDSSGTVAIKPSGWGTKVKLTVQRELALDAADAAVEREAAAIEPEPVEPEAAIEPEPVEPEAAIEAEPVEPEAAIEPDVDATNVDRRFDDDGGPGVDLDGEREPALATEAAPAAGAPTPRGFFARLFGRRRTARPQPDAPGPATPGAAEHAADEPTSGSSQALGPAEALGASARSLEPATAEAPTGASGAHDAARCSEPDAEAPVERVCVQPVGEVGDEDAAAADDDAAGEARRRDAAAELAAAEEVAVEQVAAVLSGVLDRLGAAHHRPFSRS